MDLIALAEQVFPKAASIAGNVTPAQYTDSTPCAEWDVHALLNHMISTHHMMTALLNDEVPAEPLDEIGDDPGGAYKLAIDASIAAFSQPGALDKVIALPVGRTPGSIALALTVMDNVVHGWDLATATGQPSPIDEGLAAGFLEQMRAMPLPRQPAPGAPFAAEVPVPDDASNAEKLLGFLGRTP